MRYSLKNVMLINEGIVNQGTFFENLTELIQKKPKAFERPIGQLIKKVLITDDGNKVIDTLRKKKDRIKLIKNINNAIKQSKT